MDRNDIIQDWRKCADEWAKKNGIETEGIYEKAYRIDEKNEEELDHALDNIADIPKR